MNSVNSAAALAFAGVTTTSSQVSSAPQPAPAASSDIGHSTWSYAAGPAFTPISGISAGISAFSYGQLFAPPPAGVGGQADWKMGAPAASQNGGWQMPNPSSGAMGAQWGMPPAQNNLAAVPAPVGYRRAQGAAVVGSQAVQAPGGVQPNGVPPSDGADGSAEDQQGFDDSAADASANGAKGNKAKGNKARGRGGYSKRGPPRGRGSNGNGAAAAGNGSGGGGGNGGGGSGGGAAAPKN